MDEVTVITVADAVGVTTTERHAHFAYADATLARVSVKSPNLGD